MDSLCVELSRLRERDVNFVRTAVKEVEDFCNGRWLITKPGSPENVCILGHILYQESGFAATLVNIAIIVLSFSLWRKR
jgi:hypothetical protein